MLLTRKGRPVLVTHADGGVTAAVCSPPARVHACALTARKVARREGAQPAAAQGRRIATEAGRV